MRMLVDENPIDVSSDEEEEEENAHDKRRMPRTGHQVDHGNIILQAERTNKLVREAENSEEDDTGPAVAEQEDAESSEEDETGPATMDYVVETQMD